MTDIKEIEKLVEIELKEANEKYPLFHSPHEAYAVLLEEVEEMAGDVEDIQTEMKELWHFVKEDCRTSLKVSKVKRLAIHAIREAIQVAAMCDKMKMSNIE